MDIKLTDRDEHTVRRMHETGLIVEVELHEISPSVDDVMDAVGRSGEEYLTVDCENIEEYDDIPGHRFIDEDTIVYDGFERLPKDIQVSTAQRIKAQFERGFNIVVMSYDDYGLVVAKNGDLMGRVYSIAPI